MGISGGHRLRPWIDTDMLKSPAPPKSARAVYAAIGTLADDDVAIDAHRLVTGK